MTFVGTFSGLTSLQTPLVVLLALFRIFEADPHSNGFGLLVLLQRFTVDEDVRHGQPEWFLSERIDGQAAEIDVCGEEVWILFESFGTSNRVQCRACFSDGFGVRFTLGPELHRGERVDQVEFIL